MSTEEGDISLNHSNKYNIELYTNPYVSILYLHCDLIYFSNSLLKFET